MEMHQVRYFLAVAKNLNFTRGAEECNVSQPSLTRAIKQLEGEFGADLFRRERPQAQLTELGERMLPLLKQCYESATSARELALSMKKGEVASLRLALSHTFDINLLLPHLNEVRQRFDRLECKLLRGTAAEVVELLKSGEAESASPRTSAKAGTASTAGPCSPRTSSSWSMPSIGWRARRRSSSPSCVRSACCCGAIASTPRRPPRCCAATVSTSNTRFRSPPRAT